MRIAICISILVGLQRSIFGLPSSTLSQKMCFRVGRPHFFNWKSEVVPHESTSFETKCRKVVQILIFFCRKPRVSTQNPIGRDARNHHHHQREKERARQRKRAKESEKEEKGRREVNRFIHKKTHLPIARPWGGPYVSSSSSSSSLREFALARDTSI